MRRYLIIVSAFNCLSHIADSDAYYDSYTTLNSQWLLGKVFPKSMKPYSTNPATKLARSQAVNRGRWRLVWPQMQFTADNFHPRSRPTNWCANTRAGSGFYDPRIGAAAGWFQVAPSLPDDTTRARTNQHDTIPAAYGSADRPFGGMAQLRRCHSQPNERAGPLTARSIPADGDSAIKYSKSALVKRNQFGARHRAFWRREQHNGAGWPTNIIRWNRMMMVEWAGSW